MAFKKMLSMRLRNVSKISSPNSLHNCRISYSSPSSASVKSDNIIPPKSDDGIFRRFLHRLPDYSPPSSLAGEKLIQELRRMGINNERISLDGLKPPTAEEDIEAEDARTLLKLSQLETVKSKLRQIQKSCIPYKEFVELCCATSFSHEQGIKMAKSLDQSGTVIVLGDVVFLRPQQVMKAIQGLMPLPAPHPRMKVELEQMEKQKAAIDRKAVSLVRRELWCGLGYLAIQTAVVMRLTFWELTWDVMEPICFYLTSIYFMAGYAFFLRTSKEPSFEGFFQSRFTTKQKHLMKLSNLDLDKYNQLRRACYPDSFPVKENSIPLDSYFGDFHVPVVR